MPPATPHALPSLPTGATDQDIMRLALAQADVAAAAGEVPVGAVLVRRLPDRVQVLALAHNQPVTTHDPGAHAEMLALRQAAQAEGNYRLEGLRRA
jgi:tRNA(adenine34) deaminase